MSATRSGTTSLIAHLEQFRYKERTPQHTAQMLARLRILHPSPPVVSRYLKSFAVTKKEDDLYNHLIENPTDAIGHTSGADTEMDSDVQPVTVNEVVNVPRQFVKPNSVQYRASEVEQEMGSIMQRVFSTYPEGCSESLYQKAVLREAYLSGLPVMVERDVYADYGNGSLLLGRVDMEVAGVCLYEFKVGIPKIAEHSKQLQKYLAAYDKNQENIQVAKLVYFTSDRVLTHVLRDCRPGCV
jgi:hypothetical protein